jgi:hypothetical protein
LHLHQHAAHLGVEETHIEAQLLLVNLPAHAVHIIIITVLPYRIQVTLLLVLLLMLLLVMCMRVLLAVWVALRSMVVDVLPHTADGLGVG